MTMAGDNHRQDQLMSSHGLFSWRSTLKMVQFNLNVYDKFMLSARTDMHGSALSHGPTYLAQNLYTLNEVRIHIFAWDS
jgi:hypothetical protein